MIRSFVVVALVLVASCASTTPTSVLPTQIEPLDRWPSPENLDVSREKEIFAAHFARDGGRIAVNESLPACELPEARKHTLVGYDSDMEKARLALQDAGILEQFRITAMSVRTTPEGCARLKNLPPAKNRSGSQSVIPYTPAQLPYPVQLVAGIEQRIHVPAENGAGATTRNIVSTATYSREFTGDAAFPVIDKLTSDTSGDTRYPAMLYAVTFYPAKAAPAPLVSLSRASIPASAMGATGNHIVVSKNSVLQDRQKAGDFYRLVWGNDHFMRQKNGVQDGVQWQQVGDMKMVSCYQQGQLLDYFVPGADNSCTPATDYFAPNVQVRPGLPTPDRNDPAFGGVPPPPKTFRQTLVETMAGCGKIYVARKLCESINADPLGLLNVACEVAVRKLLADPQCFVSLPIR